MLIPPLRPKAPLSHEYEIQSKNESVTRRISDADRVAATEATKGLIRHLKEKTELSKEANSLSKLISLSCKTNEFSPSMHAYFPFPVLIVLFHRLKCAQEYSDLLTAFQEKTSAILSVTVSLHLDPFNEWLLSSLTSAS